MSHAVSWGGFELRASATRPLKAARARTSRIAPNPLDQFSTERFNIAKPNRLDPGAGIRDRQGPPENSAQAGPPVCLGAIGTLLELPALSGLAIHDQRLVEGTTCVRECRETTLRQFLLDRK